jgi:hypothetical protein
MTLDYTRGNITHQEFTTLISTTAGNYNKSESVQREWKFASMMGNMQRILY